MVVKVKPKDVICIVGESSARRALSPSFPWTELYMDYIWTKGAIEPLFFYLFKY